MEALIVGEGELSLNEVAAVIKNSTSFAVLLKKWVSWARYLGINEPEIPGLKWKVNHETLELQDVPHEVLQIWKADKGSRATLKALCEALKESGVQDIAESLSEKFWGKSDKYLVNGKLYTLDQLVGASASDSFHGFSKQIKLSRKNTPIALIRDQVSPQNSPEYYVSRYFLLRSKLDETIFKHKSTKEHIFVLIGATKSEVARVCGLQMIDSSRNQLDKITVQFILLDCIEDFGKICQMTSSPVHLIKYRNGKFFWIQSTQSWEVIRKFLKQTGETKAETVVIWRIISLPSTSALSIADSPGMGKTFVLANLAKKTEETHPKAVVFFIVLQEFVRQIHLLGGSTPLDIILRYVSTNYTTKSILQKMLENNSFHFFLFLDGYDEVLQDKLHLLDSYLQDLVKLKNIRVIITTRPHLKSRLEGVLNSYSSEILPFDESNQIEFLTKYWTSNHGAVEGDSLIEFAKKCLNKLKTIMTDTERYIAGIPLQCMMLAEVYGADAKRASEQEQLPEDAVKIYSFFQMYKALIDFKLNKISDPLARQKYLDAHIYESISLLFPEWLEKFQPYLSPRNDIDKSTLYSIGLLEKIPFSGESRFVHRTFAEYLLADFVTNDLTRSSLFKDFLVKQILGETGVTIEQKIGYRWYNNAVYQQAPSLYKLKHPVVAYFINMHLRERFRNNGLPEFPITMDLENITEDVCIAASACCCNDLESLFELTSSIIKRLGISNNFKLQHKYIKHLPHLVVEWTSNPSFVRNVLNFTRSEFRMNLSYYVYERRFTYNLIIPYCTPLHVAIYNVKYNIVMCILQECGTEVLSIKHLLHACVFRSDKNSETEIEEKLSIMEALIQLRRELLEEELEGSTPLFQDGVDFKISKKLVEMGANINAYSPKYKTVLHKIMFTCSYGENHLTYSDKLEWALNNGFEVNHTDHWGRTAFMRTIQYCGLGSNEDGSLQLFNEAKADFTAEDEDGESVLFYTIRYKPRISVIEKVLYYGANPNHKNRKGMNAAHVVMNTYNSRNDQLNVVQVLKSLKSGGFDGWDQTDNDGRTPLLLAIEFQLKALILDDDNKDNLLQFLHEQGVNFNAKDHGGDSVLFYAIKKLDIGIVQKILELGANPNHKNKIGQTAADIVIGRYKHERTEVLKMLELLASKGFDEFNHSVSSAGDINHIILACKQKLNLFFKTAAKKIDENGDTILFHAIRYCDNLEVVCNILEQGCDVNHQNNFGANAAHYYINYKHSLVSDTLEFLKLLKSHGFTRVDQKDNEGCTPLMIAITKFPLDEKNWNELLQFFSEEGVDFNARDDNGRSVLLYAIDCSLNRDFIRKVLDFGANPNHRIQFGRNSAHLVLECYSNYPVLAVEVLKLLKSKRFVGFNEKDDDGCTPIMLAIKRNMVVKGEILQGLTEVGVDFNAQDRNGRSVLLYTIQYSKDPDFIRNILDFGSNPNHRMKCGSNAAHLVLRCYSNDPILAVEVLKLLKSKGFEGFNEKDDDGLTPIMHAVRLKGVVADEILQFLVVVGVDFNAQDNNGNSVLFYAIEFSKNLDFIQKILNFGAHLNHVNAVGENAAHVVMRSYQNDPILIVEVLKVLKSRGFNGLDKKSHNGEYPFMKAILLGGIVEDKVLQYLSEEGVTVDFNAQDNDGDSVLFHALVSLNAASITIIKKILDFGANPNHRNLEGQNAGHIIILFCSNYKFNDEGVLDNEREQEVEYPKAVLEILKLLESKGFKGFNQKDSKGDTPLRLAMSMNILDNELLKFLRERTLK